MELLVQSTSRISEYAKSQHLIPVQLESSTPAKFTKLGLRAWCHSSQVNNSAPRLYSFIIQRSFLFKCLKSNMKRKHRLHYLITQPSFTMALDIQIHCDSLKTIEYIEHSSLPLTKELPNSSGCLNFRLTVW